MSPASRSLKRQQEQMLMMQATTNPSMFFYLGDMPNLEKKLQETIERGVPITDVYIRVSGIQVNEFNLGLMMATILFGAFFILPLFAMCYDCWKKSVYPSYEIPINVYQKLQFIISTQSLRTFHFQVCDNNFNKEKAQLMFQMLSTSSTQTFIFINVAANMDFKENEYSNFVENMKPIKMLPIQSNMRWWTEIIA